MRLLGAMALLALAAASPGASASAASHASTASFDATLTVTQDVSWTQEVTGRGCDGGLYETHGHGSAHLRVRTKRPQRLIARRVSGPREALLTFAGGVSTVPVTGTLTRTGERTFGPSVGGTGTPCGQPLPVARDCGRRSLPSDARMGVAYWSPALWPYDGDPALPALTPAVVVSGPTTPSWQGAGERFQNCPGIDGDGDLFVLTGSPDVAPSGPGVLMLEGLFGSARRLTARATARRTSDPNMLPNAYVSGRFAITVVNRFTLTLTRRHAGASRAAP